MAIYSSGSMSGSGTPGEVLTATTTYTFALQNRGGLAGYTGSFAGATEGHWPQIGTSYLALDGDGIPTQQAGGVISKSGPLNLGSIPLSNTVSGITGGPYTFIFDVNGDLFGGGAIISLTSAGGAIVSARVVNGGLNFQTGDGITISQNDLQAAGFTNANASQQIDVFANYINDNIGNPQSITGSFGGFLNSINQSSLVEEPTKFSIMMPNSGSIGGAFTFTPTTTIPASSYAIRATGNFELSITS